MATWLLDTNVIHPTRPLPGSEFRPGALVFTGRLSAGTGSGQAGDSVAVLYNTRRPWPA